MRPIPNPHWNRSKPASGLVSLVIFCSVALSSAFAQVCEIQVNAQIEPFVKEDRVFILAPHPDDETIGCAGVIQRALKAGARVKVMYLTNGDHNEFAFLVYEKRPILFNREFVRMGKVREEEAKKAMKILGVNEAGLIFLGYPDYGTDVMFSSFWETQRPFADRLTRQPYVPYKESPSYGAPYKAENLLADIKRALSGYKPTKIFISHAADVNGDHWAYYCFLQVALRDLRKEIPEPKVYVYLVHASGWSLPRHFHPDLYLYPYEKHFPDALVKWQRFDLTPDEIDKKHKAMLAYRSQTCVSAFYLLSFIRRNELFGDYPLQVLKKQTSRGRSNVPDVADNFFKDNDKISYAVVDNHLWIRVRKPPELRNRLILDFYIFGYSDETPFAKMPNVWVQTKYKRFKMYETDEKKEMDAGDTSVDLSRTHLTLKVPLSVLGGPDFALVCVETRKSFLSLESMGWRRIEIEE